MRFELVNPSDEIWLTAPDLKMAAVAALIVGGGAYGLTTEAGERAMPVMLSEIDEDWSRSVFGDTPAGTAVEDVIDERPAELAACFESFELARERTSLNDICGRARRLAEALRDSLKGNG